MRTKILGLLTLSLLFLQCQKEPDVILDNKSTGTLQKDGANDCLPKIVNGIYIAGTALTPANNIQVIVNVTKAGTYTISTDTVSGMSFSATGTFAATGTDTLTLQGSGTPLAAGAHNLLVKYGTSTCDVTINVLPTGTTPAVFTLAGAPSACSSYVVNGTYTVGNALTASNTVTLNVNVTTIGVYNVSTSQGGMIFSKTGSFAATGVQTLILDGSGTPTTNGPNTFSITAGSSTCSFIVNVGGVSPATGTLGGSPNACTPATFGGTYTAGIALTSSNTLQIQVNVSTIGTYTISTNTVDGFSFSKSGTFSATGVQSVTLDGTGTPATAGVKNFTITFGTSTCTASVTVAPGGGGPATGTLGGAPGACTPATPAGTYTVGSALTGANTVTIQVNVATIGTYSISTNTVTGFSFSKSGSFSATGVQNLVLDGAGTPTTAGTQTFTVTWATSTCTFTINVGAAAPMDYFPRATNNNWSYEFDNVQTDSFYRVAIAATHSALGNIYNIFMGNDGTGLDSSGYYRKQGGDYFEYLDFGTYIGYDGPSWNEYLMVKDNVPAMTNWKTPINGFPGTYNGGTPINLRFSMTILQKDVPISVVTSTGTVNYTNVIVVEEKFEVEVTPGNWADATSLVGGYGKSYYARNIGLIKYEILDPGGTNIFLQELRRHQVQ